MAWSHLPNDGQRHAGCPSTAGTGEADSWRKKKEEEEEEEHSLDSEGGVAGVQCVRGFHEHVTFPHSASYRVRAMEMPAQAHRS